MRRDVSEKISWKILVGFASLILALAYVVEKEVSLPAPIILLIALGGGAFLILNSLAGPEIPLYVLAAYIPFNYALPGTFGGTLTALNLTNLLCVVVMIGLLCRSMKRGGFWLKSNLNVPILLFTLVGGVSLIWGSWAYGVWYLWAVIIPLKRWLTPLLFYFLTLWVVEDRRILKTVVVILMISVAVVGLLAVKEHIDIGEAGSIESERVGGIAGQPNMLAAFFVYYMFLFASFFLGNARKPRYWLLLIPFLVCFRGIQVTFSRGGYLAFFAGGLALSFFRSRVLFGVVIFVLVLALLNPVLLPEGIRYRLLSTFRGVQASDEEAIKEVATDISKGEDLPLEGSAQGRLSIWKGALKIIRDHPWWGTGYGTFGAIIPYYAPELRGRRMDAHNSYLIIAAEMGIPALCIFLWVLFLVIWKSYRLYRIAKDPFVKATALGFLAGLFALIVANMFGSRVDAEEISGYFWVLAAIIVRGMMFEKSVRPIPVKAAAETPSRPLKKAKSLTASLRRLDELKHETT